MGFSIAFLVDEHRAYDTHSHEEEPWLQSVFWLNVAHMPRLV